MTKAPMPPRNHERIIDLDCPLPSLAPPFLARLVAATAQSAGTSKTVLLAHTRQSETVRARQVGIWIAYHATARSLPDIGRAFNRDHSTVIAAVRAVERRLVAEREETIEFVIDVVRRMARVRSRAEPANFSAAVVAPKLHPAPAGFRAWCAENDASFRAGFLAAHPERSR